MLRAEGDHTFLDAAQILLVHSSVKNRYKRGIESDGYNTQFLSYALRFFYSSVGRARQSDPMSSRATSPQYQYLCTVSTSKSGTLSTSACHTVPSVQITNPFTAYTHRLKLEGLTTNPNPVLRLREQLKVQLRHFHAVDPVTKLRFGRQFYLPERGGVFDVVFAPTEPDGDFVLRRLDTSTTDVQQVSAAVLAECTVCKFAHKLPAPPRSISAVPPLSGAWFRHPAAGQSLAKLVLWQQKSGKLYTVRDQTYVLPFPEAHRFRSLGVFEPLPEEPLSIVNWFKGW